MGRSLLTYIQYIALYDVLDVDKVGEPRMD